MQVTSTDTIDRVLLVRSVERRQTRDGSAFLRMALGDRSGSLPGVREAALVHAIDDLSGQLGAFDRLEKAAAPGERWSRYDRVLGGCAFFGGR